MGDKEEEETKNGRSRRQQKGEKESDGAVVTLDNSSNGQQQQQLSSSSSSSSSFELRQKCDRLTTRVNELQQSLVQSHQNSVDARKVVDEMIDAIKTRHEKQATQLEQKTKELQQRLSQKEEELQIVKQTSVDAGNVVSERNKLKRELVELERRCLSEKNKVEEKIKSMTSYHEKQRTEWEGRRVELERRLSGKEKVEVMMEAMKSRYEQRTSELERHLSEKRTEIRKLKQRLLGCECERERDNDNNSNEGVSSSDNEMVEALKLQHERQRNELERRSAELEHRLSEKEAENKISKQNNVNAKKLLDEKIELERRTRELEQHLLEKEEEIQNLKLQQQRNERDGGGVGISPVHDNSDCGNNKKRLGMLWKELVRANDELATKDVRLQRQERTLEELRNDLVSLRNNNSNNGRDDDDVGN